MNLHHEFEVAVDVRDAWPAFLDMPRIAPCMPGAEVTEVIDERHVKGEARVKVGPVSLRFAGVGEMTEIDDGNRSAVLAARGSDAKGRGNADADVRFSLHDAGENLTRVEVHTTLNLTGSVAQYGRASGLVDEIANQLIADFVECLERELARPGPDPAGGGVPAVGEAAAERPAAGAISGSRLFLRAVAALLGRWWNKLRNRT